MQRAVQLGRLARGDMSMKKPVLNLVIVTDDVQLRDDLVELRDYVQEELNAFDLVAAQEPGAWGKLSVVCQSATMGKRLRAEYDKVRKLVEAHPDPASILKALEGNGKFSIGDKYEILPGDVSITREFIGDAAKYGVGTSPDLLVCVDKTVTDLMLDVGLAREFKSTVQRLRKSAGLIPEDKVVVYCQVPEGKGEKLRQVLFNDKDADAKVAETLGLVVHPMEKISPFAIIVGSVTETLDDVTVKICLTRRWIRYAEDEKLEFLLNAIGLDALQGAKELKISLDGTERIVKGFEIVT